MKRALLPLLLVLLSGPVTRAQTAPEVEFTQDDYDRCVTACWMGPAPCANKGSCGVRPTCDPKALSEAALACRGPIFGDASLDWAARFKKDDLLCGPKFDAWDNCYQGYFYHDSCMIEKRECDKAAGSWYDWYVNTTGHGPFHYTETPGICSSTSEPTATCVCRTFYTVDGKRVDSKDPETYKQLSCSASY